MQNVVLVIHLILSVSMIAIVLLQRSEGGGLGIGGGGNGGGGRPKASPLSKVTWFIAIGFLATSISLTIIAARESGQGSVIDGFSAPDVAAPELPTALDGNLLPPSATDEPALPPSAE